MKTLLLSAVLALVLLAPAQADAQWRRWSAPSYYPTYPAYPTYYGPAYYPPAVSYYPRPTTTYYGAPYDWSGNTYVTPYSRGVYYDTYYPYTNQYYYQYRVVPRGY